MARFLDDISNGLKGFGMGAANLIPGVSGGTIAFITGIYERLINAIKSCNPTAIKLLLGRRFEEFAAHVDLRFLTAVAVGVGLSFALLAKLLGKAFDEHPVPTWAFFFGLIVASIWGVGKMVKRWSVGPVVGLLFGLGVAVGVMFLPHASGNSNPGFLVICGAIAIASMIIPGVSGSYVLLLMGNYALVLGAVGRFDLGILVPVGIGCVIGLLSLSHLLSWIFKHHHDLAVGLITGFIVGSLVLIWPWKETVIKQDAAGAYMVKTAEREVVARGTDLEAVRAGLAEGEELVEAGYRDWHLPSLAEREDQVAIALAMLGAMLVLLIEWLGSRFGRHLNPESDDAGAG